MARDINTKKLKKNAFRYSKVRGETASRIRIPGGVINAKSMAKIAEVAETYGNGTIFVTNRLSTTPVSTRKSATRDIRHPEQETWSHVRGPGCVRSGAMTRRNLHAKWIR